MFDDHEAKHRMNNDWRLKGGAFSLVVLLLPACGGCRHANRTASLGDLALHVAAESRDTTEAEKAIADGSDVNRRDAQGRTPLHRAAGTGALTCVTLFLDHGADIDARDQLLQTPLHKAAAAHYSEVVRTLLDRGGDVNALDEIGNTPMDATSDVARLRWPAGDSIRESGRTAGLLRQAGATYGDTETYDHSGRRAGDYSRLIPAEPPLCRAGVYLGMREVERLLAEGASIDERSSGGRTILHLLAFRGMTDRVEFFLNHGADVNARNEQGHTPLHVAAGEGYKDVVAVLLAHGANVYAVNSYRESPLAKLALGASRRAQEDVYREYGVGRLGDFVGTAEVLIANGSWLDNVNSPGSRGTPLHHAAYSQYVDVVRVLLAHGADATVPNEWGKTPCIVAKKENHMAMVDLVCR